MPAIRISLYLAAFILANYVVIWYGKNGLIFTAFFLVPFDFVMRCIFHENYKGFKLFIFMSFLVSSASLITYYINQDAKNIAIASACSFIIAQTAASVFYQVFINKKYIFKVNGSDAIGIVFDSITFQIIAFSFISLETTFFQIIIKIIGGLLWYWIIFEKLKIKINK